MTAVGGVVVAGVAVTATAADGVGVAGGAVLVTTAADGVAVAEAVAPVALAAGSAAVARGTVPAVTATEGGAARDTAAALARGTAAGGSVADAGTSTEGGAKEPVTGDRFSGEGAALAAGAVAAIVSVAPVVGSLPGLMRSASQPNAASTPTPTKAVTAKGVLRIGLDAMADTATFVELVASAGIPGEERREGSGTDAGALPVIGPATPGQDGELWNDAGTPSSTGRPSTSPSARTATLAASGDGAHHTIAVREYGPFRKCGRHDRRVARRGCGVKNTGASCRPSTLCSCLAGCS